MSRFFTSVEDEKDEVKRPTLREKVYDAADKQSKKERKLNDLRGKVIELEEEENQKAFDKQLKKIFVDIRKAESCFGDGVPGFLRTFLTSPRVYNKAHKDAIDGLLSKYEPQGKEPVVEEGMKKEEICRDLDKILVIKDLEQRRNGLLALKDNVDGNFVRVRILMTLLSIYMKSSDGMSIMAIMDELVNCLAKDDDIEVMRNTFVDNIDFYLETVYEDSSSSLEVYERLLNKLLPLRRCIVERRLLQLKFFRLDQTPETQNPLFRLVYVCRTMSYEEARKHYEEIRAGIGDDRMDLEVLQEFGLCAFHSGDFETSFEALSTASKSFRKESDLKIKLLCVILNDRIRESPTYKTFLEDFRELGKNKFCFPSGNDTLEVYRSFYLLNMYDLAGAGRHQEEALERLPHKHHVQVLLLHSGVCSDIHCRVPDKEVSRKQFLRETSHK